MHAAFAPRTGTPRSGPGRDADPPFVRSPGAACRPFLRPSPRSAAAFRGPAAAVAAVFVAAAILAVPSGAGATSGKDIFREASPSIVVVQVKTLYGADSLGSGVVVGENEVVTNYHVVQNAARITVYKALGGTSGKHHPLQARRAMTCEQKWDLCLLSVTGLSAPPAAPVVRMGKAKTMSPGETVYAIGAPKGLALTMSSGIVSQLRGAHGRQGAPTVQTDTPISQGSSGGGLFNTDGELVGITTFKRRGGENLNFAMPAELVAELQARRRSRSPAASATVPSAGSGLPPSKSPPAARGTSSGQAAGSVPGFVSGPAAGQTPGAGSGRAPGSAAGVTPGSTSGVAPGTASGTGSGAVPGSASGAAGGLPRPVALHPDCQAMAVAPDLGDAPLTREEKLARMDKAFEESLARFERCQAGSSLGAAAAGGQGEASGQSAGTGTGGGSGDSASSRGTGSGGPQGAGGPSGPAAGTPAATGAAKSESSRSVAGTEPPPAGAAPPVTPSRTAQGNEPETVEAKGSSAAKQPEKDVVLPSSGKAPDDIPPSDNDSVVAAQIRAAAEAEKDPKIQAKLWNEYRKIKGLRLKEEN